MDRRKEQGQSSCSPSPPPLEHHLHAIRRRRFQEGSLRHPHTMPQCLQPHGRFSSHLRYTLHDPNAPPHYGDLFPPGYGIVARTTLCLWYNHPYPISTYNPPPSFIFDPPPPYSLVYPQPHSESETLMSSLPMPLDLAMKLIQIGIKYPHIFFLLLIFPPITYLAQPYKNMLN